MDFRRGYAGRLACALGLLLALAPPLLAQPAAPASGDRARAEAQDKLTAERLKRDRDYKAALNGFAKAHALDPAYPDALFHMGLMASQLEDWPAAIRYYEAYKALDNTSDLYVQSQLKLEEARANQERDATPEGKRKRQAEAAKAAAERARARLQQDVDEAELKLSEYDKQIADALKDYLPTSQHVIDLKQAREGYYRQAEPRLLEALDAREAEWAAMAREMRPTAAPLVAKRAEVDRLRQLCKPTLLARLFAAADAAKSRRDIRGEYVAIQQALAVDPRNADAAARQAKLLPSFAITNSLGMKLAFIPPGEFTMGSPDGEAGHVDNETQHKVVLTRGFHMGTTPVTQKQWKAVMGTDPSNFKGDDRPVEQVSWDDAVEFCRKLSEKEGKKYCLPTEAGWEYACRAGTTGAYGGTGNLGEMGWYRGNSDNETHPVGQKKANAWGLYDMHGNVWQWCGDWYGDYPSAAVGDPTGPNSGSSRVLRGGSWGIEPTCCRAAFRNRVAPDLRTIFIGFRVCLDF